ncbi:nuclear pore complex protein NUP1-like isoform X1 [Magnolia sinica]|uniref:nuclear pore complex protein NUP1-like isoform X1 n=1 Tax=Magnolia sinica TaxID=86752 RepID=UPI002657C1E1|nr:nuclear pore complex protein NUP1-like isoform X1 [Magnolia sinica]
MYFYSALDALLYSHQFWFVVSEVVFLLSRVEIDRLTELLRSRTVDASADDEDKKIEPSTSQMVAPPAGQEKATISTQENVRSSRLFGSISTPAIDLSVPEEQISSPAELAKAYMGSRSSKLSPPKLGLRNRIFRDDTASPNILQFTLKSPNVSLGARSVGRFSGVPALSENSYQTPRPRGRSSMSSMTHSPYSRLHSIASLKGTEPIDDGHVGPSTSSQWPRVNNMLSNGNQVLKRRSSIIEFGSVGPIRRVRQKSNLISPLKDVNSTHRNPPVSFSQVGSDAVQGSMSSMQVPLMMDETKYNASNLHVAENRDNRISTTNFTCLPPQSSEVAQKILQQLDKLAPSPKERSSELKATISKEKSPAISMCNMLNGQPLKIMEDMQTPKFQNAQGGGTLNELSWTRNEVSPGNAISHNQDRGEVNGPMTTAHAVVKVSEASGVEKTVFSVKDTLSGMRHADSAIFGLAGNPPCGKQVFQMSAPKATAEKEKRQSSASEQKTVVAEAVKAEKPLLSSSGSQPAASLTFNKGANTTTKASDGHIVAEKAATFTSPTTPSLLPTRTVQSSSLFNSSVLLKEQTGIPIFSFDPKSAEKGAAVTFSSISTNASSTLGLKFDSTELLSSNVTATVIPSINLPEATSSGRSDKNQKARDVNISSEKVVASAVSTSTTPTFFAFGASTNSSPSNGFPTPTASSVSNTPAVHVSLISSSSTATTSSSSSPSTSTAAAPTFHAASMFKLGTTSAAVAHSNSVSLPSTTSGLKPALIETKQASPFSSTISTVVPASPSAFTSSGSSNVFRLSASAPSSTTNSSSSANNQSQNLTSFSGAAGSLFGSAKPFTQSKPSQHASGSSPFGSSASSPSFGLSGSSSFGSSSSSFASLAPSGQTFGSGSGHGLSSSAPFLAGAGSLSSSSSGSSLFSSGSQPASGTASSSLATGFSFGAIPAAGGTAPPATGFSFGASAAAAGSKSASSPATGLSFGASAAAASSTPASSLAAGFSFGASTTAAGSFPASSPLGTGFSFGAYTATAGSLPASSPPATWFSFGASTTAASSTPASSPPATRFSFGASAAAAASSAPLTFGSSGGASSSSPFSFTSAAAGPTKSLLSPAQPLFGTSIPVVGFRSASPVNVQMNVEDSMAEDTVQASMPVAPAFNQPAQSASPFNFNFSSATPSGGPPAFQFGSQQNPATPQHPSPFPATGSLELPGGGFSLGTGSVDKSSRRIVRVRNKLRKK